MEHNIVFLEEQENNAVFQCVTCKQIIGFAQEGYGDPHATLVDGVWTAPDDVADYISPCWRTCEACGQVIPEPPAPEE